MHDDVEIIDHLPGHFEVAINGAGPEIEFIPQFIGDLSHDGPQVRFGGPGGNHEIIGNRGEVLYVQNDDIFGLLGIGQLAAKQRQFFGIHSLGKS